VQLAKEGYILLLTSTNEVALKELQAGMSICKTHILAYNLLEIDGIYICCYDCNAKVMVLIVLFKVQDVPAFHGGGIRYQFIKN
jgi:hypothetical protein